MKDKSKSLFALRRYLETGIGPAPRPTDAQVGMIVSYVQRRFLQHSSLASEQVKRPQAR
jgi:hypothetical protein